MERTCTTLLCRCPLLWRIGRPWLRAWSREGGHQGAGRVTLAPLLGGGIQNLPSIVRGAQVSPHKPGFIPDMEIPADRSTGCRACLRPHSRQVAKSHIWDLTVQRPNTHPISLLCASCSAKAWRALPHLNPHSTMKWALFLCPSHKRGNWGTERLSSWQWQSQSLACLTPKPRSSTTMFSCLSEEQNRSRLEPETQQADPHSFLLCVLLAYTSVFPLGWKWMWLQQEPPVWEPQSLWAEVWIEEWQIPVLKCSSSMASPCLPICMSKSWLPSLTRDSQLAKVLFILSLDSAIFSPHLHSHCNYTNTGFGNFQST